VLEFLMPLYSSFVVLICLHGRNLEKGFVVVVVVTTSCFVCMLYILILSLCDLVCMHSLK